MKTVRIIMISTLVLISCNKRSYCSCEGSTGSKTYRLQKHGAAIHPLEQCQMIEETSDDNYICVYKE